MAIKDIIDTAVGVGKSAVSRGREVAERRLRGDKSTTTTSGSPSTVGAAEPGTAGGPKSATASTRPKKAKPRKAKPKAKPAAEKRATATRAAADSGKEVSDAAKNA